MRRVVLLVALLAALGGAAWWLARGDGERGGDGALARAREELPSGAAAGDALAQAAEPGAAAREGVGAATDAAPGTEDARGGPPRLRVRGVVRDEQDAPVAGARVELTLARGTTADLLGDAESGADGRFAIDGPPLADFVRRRALRGMLRIGAWRAGFRPGLASGMEPDADGLVRVALRLAPGAAVRGRVVDARGRPVVGAQVSLLAPFSDTPGEGWRVRARVPSGVDGRFALPVNAEAGALAVHARADGLGSARRDGVAPADGDVGTLALSGGGALAGSVRHVDGAPARGFELVATRLADEPPRERGGALFGPDDVGGGAGLERAETRTDDAGRFELTGLRPGDWELAPVEPDARLDGLEQRYSTAGGDIALVVLGRRLHVRTVDERGAPLVGALVRLRVLDAGADAAGPERTRLTDGEDARVAFELPPGAARVGLSAALRERGPVEALVELPAGVRELERELVLPAHVAPGELAVRLTSVAGPPPLADVELRSAVTGLRERGFYAVDGAGRSPPLAPGRYFVGARSRPWKDGAGDWLPVERAEPVEVRPGEATTVRLELPVGGRLALRLVPPADGPALVEPPGLDRGASWALRRELLERHGASVRARRADAPADDPGLSLRFLVDGGAWEEERARLVPGLETGTSEPLPPGAYVLRVDGPGWAPAEARAVVAAGAVARVDVPLTARADER